MHEQRSAVRSDARNRALLALVVALGGCGLEVKPFSGTQIAFELAGAGVTAPGEHLELWGHNDDDGIFRISYLIGSDERYGMQVRIAVDPRDPCSINETGYLLTDERAYPASVVVGGVTQTPAEQAIRASTRRAQITSTALGGMQTSDLLAVTPYDPTPWPQLAGDASAADRLAACQAYWNASPYSYTANPLTPGNPLHSVSLGSIDYQTAHPAQTFSDVELTTPFDLSDLQDLWITRESVPPAAVDPLHRGPVWLVGTRVPADDGGRGTTSFELRGDGMHGSLVLVFPRPDNAF